MNLPRNERSFDLQCEGEVTGKKYEGTFTTKCMLSMADKRRLEIERSALSADLQNPTGNLNAISVVVANLRVRVTNSPDWFKQAISSLDILDEDVFFNIYSECLKLSDEWLNEVKKKSLGENEGNLQKES
jgi:hypothetical protein